LQLGQFFSIMLVDDFFPSGEKTDQAEECPYYGPTGTHELFVIEAWWWAAIKKRRNRRFATQTGLNNEKLT